jgi:hypothetical protein
MFMMAEQLLNENGHMNPAKHYIEEEAARIAQTRPEEPIEEQNGGLEPNQEEQTPGVRKENLSFG